jgi:hypothetical protein
MGEENYKVLVQKIFLPGDTFYIFATDPSKLEAGDYMKFSPEAVERTSIRGPQELVFVRGELLNKMGGLEEALRRIKSGQPLMERRER